MESVAMHLLSELSRFTALAFVAGLWQGLAMISAAALCFRLLPRVDASIRFAVWGLVFALLAAIPMLYSPVAVVRRPHVPHTLVHLGAGWAIAIACTWAALTVWRVGQLLIQAVCLAGIWRRATPVICQDEALAVLANGKRRAVLCTSVDVDAPSVIGFLSPRLLIPEWMFAKLTLPELRQVLLHECEHLRRCDDWINLLQKIALAVFPLNLSLLWLDRRLSLERELACDASVVACSTTRFDYANCLTTLAEHRMARRRIGLLLSAWGRQSELAQRVHSLLRPMRRMSPLHARVSLAVLGVALTGAAMEMARVPSFISFENSSYRPTIPAIEDAAGPSLKPAGVRTTRADYRQTVQSQPRLLDANLTFSKVQHPGTRYKPAFRQSSQRDVPGAPATPGCRQPRVLEAPRALLTSAIRPVTKSSARYSSHALPRTVYALDIEFSPSYAAVPFGDGWLLVQL